MITVAVDVSARARRAVRGVLLAAAAPLVVRDIEHLVYAFGHKDLTPLDVRDALADLVREGLARRYPGTDYTYTRPEAEA